MKNIYCVSPKQHGNMKSGVLRSRNATIFKLGALVHCLARMSKKSNYPHRHVNAIALHVFVTVTAKLQQFVMNDQIFHNWSRVSTNSTSWDYSVSTRDTLWRQHYVGTSKEYLINCHILLQYFELVFLQLQVIQILCKLIIIWVNYEKKQIGALYETPCRMKAWISVGLCVCLFGDNSSKHKHFYRKWSRIYNYYLCSECLWCG